MSIIPSKDGDVRSSYFFVEAVTACTTILKQDLTLDSLVPIFLIVLNTKLSALYVDIVLIKRHCYRSVGFFKPLDFLQSSLLLRRLDRRGRILRRPCFQNMLLKTNEYSQYDWMLVDRDFLHLCVCFCAGVFFFPRRETQPRRGPSSSVSQRDVLCCGLPQLESATKEKF